MTTSLEYNPELLFEEDTESKVPIDILTSVEHVAEDYPLTHLRTIRSPKIRVDLYLGDDDIYARYGGKMEPLNQLSTSIFPASERRRLMKELDRKFSLKGGSKLADAYI